jgi:hypothetical protein
MRSNFLRLNYSDYIKGFLMAFITAILTAVYTAINSNTFSLDWIFFKPIIMIGLASGIGYLIKNVLTNNEGQFLKKNSPEMPVGNIQGEIKKDETTN